jgi:hypothetical protein
LYLDQHPAGKQDGEILQADMWKGKKVDPGISEMHLGLRHPVAELTGQELAHGGLIEVVGQGQNHSQIEQGKENSRMKEEKACAKGDSKDSAHEFHSRGNSSGEEAVPAGLEPACLKNARKCSMKA